MMGPANSSADEPIGIYDQKISYDKMWNFHHVGNVNDIHLIELDFKATKSDESRTTMERQKCKPSNQYPLFDQGYPWINYWYYGYP